MIVFCSSCGTREGRLCAACGKGRHFTEKSVRQNGAPHGNPCYIALKNRPWRDRTRTCSAHQAPRLRCDMGCGTEHADFYGTEVVPPNGWHRVSGITASTIVICGACHRNVRVGLDWALERNDAPLLTESIACAFAFQLGQNAWHRPELLANMSPAYAPGPGSGPCKVCGDPFDHGGRPHSEASRVQPPLTVAHVLDSGLTLCGLWPEQMGGAWVRVEHWQQADCRVCRQRGAARMGVTLASVV